MKADKDWRKKARKAIQEERESLNQFRKTYTPPSTRDEMIRFINGNDVITVHPTLETMTDYELADLCLEISWMQTRQ